MATCGECEFFGNYDYIINSQREPVPGNEGKFYRTPFLCFDESKGAICAFPRTGTKCRCYDNSPACHRFKERTWARADSCHNCARKVGEMSDGSVLCDGWPYYKHEGDEPCQNGKTLFGVNLKLF